MVTALRVKFSLYEWSDEEIETLINLFKILRSTFRFRAAEAWNRVKEEIEETNWDRFIEENTGETVD
jgi:ABC-type uncharacterized transport system permease subunit